MAYTPPPVYNPFDPSNPYSSVGGTDTSLYGSNGSTTNPLETFNNAATAPAVTAPQVLPPMPTKLDFWGNPVGQDGKSTMGGLGGIGWNSKSLNLGLEAFGTLGNIWNAWEARKLAKEQFKFQKDITNTNLANSIQAYNTRLYERTRAADQTAGRSEDQTLAYTKANEVHR